MRRVCALAAGRAGGTFGAVDAGVLVVAQEESLLAAALVAPHRVDTNVLAATVVEHALVCV